MQITGFLISTLLGVAFLEKCALRLVKGDQLGDEFLIGFVLLTVIVESLLEVFTDFDGVRHA
jgi:hypothetical protein